MEASENSLIKTVGRPLSNKDIFDPRIIDDDTSRQLWNSESVDLANKGLAEGYKLKDNPFLKFVKDVKLRKANLPYKYTPEEIECLQICCNDKIFFGNNFAKLKDANKGWINIILRNYQEKLLHQYTNNRWNILLFPRQSGKTTTTIIQIVHFCCFNVDKDCVVIAQSEKVVDEILTKIKNCFAGLPFFMQPGFVTFTKKGFVLDNGCRLSIGVASESVVQGFSLDLLFIDEFAYIANSVAESFWNNIYPALTNNPESQCIIASTSNGRNLFWKLWTGAINGTNKFTPYRIYWYDVPGRDNQFKKDTIANIGLNGWLLGFECSFDVGLKSIFNSIIQQKLRVVQTDNENNWSRQNDLIGNSIDIKFLDKKVLKYNTKEDYFLFSIDIGEGLEQDYSVIKIKKVSWNIQKQRLEYDTIGVFHRNDISVEDFAFTFLGLLKHFDKNKIKVVVENNTYGGEFFAQVDNQVRNNPKKYYWFGNHVFATFMRTSKNDYERGIRWNQYNKKTAVKSFSTLVSNEIMKESYSLTIEEYLNFGRQKNGSFAASYGHDDLTMADVTAAYFIKCGDLFTTQWLHVVESELRLLLDDEPQEIKQKKAEEERKKQNRFTHNGFEIHEFVEKDMYDDIYMFDI